MPPRAAVADDAADAGLLDEAAGRHARRGDLGLRVIVGPDGRKVAVIGWSVLGGVIGGRCPVLLVVLIVRDVRRGLR
jgi:hypothetical protein